MAASTLKRIQSRKIWWMKNNRPKQIGGLVGVKRIVTVPASSVDDIGDIVLMYLFPRDCMLYGDAVSLSYDDFDGGSTLTVDIGIGGADGAMGSVALLTNSTALRSGGNSYISLTPNFWTDISSNYLTMKVKAAATTPLSGDITFSAIVSVGMLVSSG